MFLIRQIHKSFCKIIVIPYRVDIMGYKSQYSKVIVIVLSKYHDCFSQ